MPDSTVYWPLGVAGIARIIRGQSRYYRKIWGVVELFQKIWGVFQIFAEEIIKFARSHYEELKGAGVRPWNGRQIRNLF